MVKEKTREIELTEREINILERISRGYNDKEIAEDLKISYPTVRSCLTILLAKTSTVNRIQLCCWALRNKYIK